jgi:RNA polymerase sigma-70 factor (ECF subfamily)
LGRTADAEDAFQDVFVRYATKAPEFADANHEKAWLITVASNICRDLLRKRKREAVSTDKIDEVAGQAADPSQAEHPETLVEAEPDPAVRLTGALQKVDPKYREVLYLTYYENMPAAQVATALGIPTNTVYTRLARGRERLKEVLEYE